MIDTKQINIERAKGTVRLIAGRVSSLKRSYGNSWTLAVDQNDSRYCISLWDDGPSKPHYQSALDLQVGDIATLQVYENLNTAYEDWKLWDFLSFTSRDHYLINQINNDIKANTKAYQASIQHRQAELKQINEIQDELDRQERERKTNNAWRALAGIGTALGCIIAAPATGCASLLGLGGAGLMLQSNTGGGLAHTQLQHRRDNIARFGDLMSQQAGKALDSVDSMEHLLAAAKLQPWKSGHRQISHGLLPDRLRSELIAAAYNGASITIDATTIPELQLAG